MKSKIQFKTNKSKSTIYSAFVGAGFALIISILLSAIITSFVMNGRMNESGTNWSIFVIRAISIFVGTLMGTFLSKEKYLIVIGLIISIYTIILISLSIILYDRSFQNFWTELFSVVLGGGVGYAIKLKKITGSKRVKFNKK